MNDQELIGELYGKATAIMHEPSAVVTNDPSGRADRLEKAFMYMICCAILNNEISFEELKRLKKKST